MRKRIRKIIIISLIAVLLLDAIIVAISSYITSRDKEWGLHVSATNVSSTGLTLTLERKDSENTNHLTTGDDYWVYKKTILGWKALKTIDDTGITFLSIGYPMDNGDSKTWDIKWDLYFGKLAPGIYRISKGCSADSSGYSEEEIKEQNLEPKLYATFLVLF